MRGRSGSGLSTGVTLPTGNVVRFSGAGSRTATLELTALADGVSKSTETCRVSLGTNAQFDANTLGTNVGVADPHPIGNSFSVALNDPTVVTLSRRRHGRHCRGRQEGGKVEFTVTLSRWPALI